MIFCCVASIVAAQSMTVRRVSFEECVDSAVAHNPAVEAAALEIERSRVLKSTAFDAPMTEITLKQETTGGGGPENGVYFGQEFAFPSVYVARGKSLSARHDLAQGRFDVLVADLERDIARVFEQMKYTRSLISLTDSLSGLYEEFCRVASVRLENGEGGRLELMNAERMREKNVMEAAALESEYAALTVDLQRIACLSGPAEPAESHYGPLEGDFGSCEFSFASTPRGIAAQREIDVAEREITVAKNELLPGLKVGATAQAVIKGFNPYHVDRSPFEKGNFMGFEIGLTVPLFFGAPSAKVKAARLEKQILMLNRESEELKAGSEVTALKEQLGVLGLKLRYYKETALPRAQEIMRIAKVSYDLGEIDYLEYISNMETAYEVNRDYYDCINNYNKIVLRLKAYTRK